MMDWVVKSLSYELRVCFHHCFGTFQEPWKRPVVAERESGSYAHQRKSDGSFDAICTQCFQVIANADSEGELLEAEKAHVCGGLNLNRLLYPGK